MACSGPVVLLEVQMHPDPGFRHRLAPQPESSSSSTLTISTELLEAGPSR
jgi:hypothetical protein